VHADEKLTAFLELESVIRTYSGALVMRPSGRRMGFDRLNDAGVYHCSSTQRMRLLTPEADRKTRQVCSCRVVTMSLF
jgi:hypothetical protein